MSGRPPALRRHRRAEADRALPGAAAGPCDVTQTARLNRQRVSAEELE
ncbi:MAG: hypothetical protein LBE67_16270 [Kocuria palustris]|nr:hypothetical protein [Kocuria palustris]